ncbi:MAG: response regulator transcription factor [Taibaiella sp.]|nr:response regulator transcription factor [Taibaiella sp.]
MQTTKILIVDDEPLAQELLESYILKISGLEIVAKCKDALEAFGVLSRNTVDIMLLDINMPEINGIDFLKTIKNPPYVIFATAYSEYAVESYEYNAMDYLLKPISFERFLKAINKSQQIIQASKKELLITNARSSHDGITLGENIMFVKSDGILIKIDLTNLWFVEGLKDYIQLWTDTGKVIVHSTMKNIEDHFSHIPYLIRVHKSYIVNIKFISTVDGNIIRIKGQMITIGNTYKDDIQKMFDNNKLL